MKRDLFGTDFVLEDALEEVNKSEGVWEKLFVLKTQPLLCLKKFLLSLT